MIIDYLSGASRLQPQGGLIISVAERGETQIIVSALAGCEVVKPEGLTASDAEQLIREFFGRPYVLWAALDPPIAEIARDLVRKFGIKGADAAHVATALHWGIPIFETVDDNLRDRLNNRVAADPMLLPRSLTIQAPFWEGQQPLLELL